MKKAIVLFTGGKESVFSMLTVKSQGYQVEELVFLEKPGFSVHKVNLPAIKAIANGLGYNLKVIKVDRDFWSDELLINYLRKRREEGVDSIVTGNVKLDENSELYNLLCEEAGLALLEPLKGLDTLELLTKYHEIGMHFLIVGIRDECLDLRWLGKIVTKESFEEFLSSILAYGIDPCGEYGEYHSLVITLKEFNIGINFNKISSKKRGDILKYVILSDPHIIESFNDNNTVTNRCRYHVEV